MFLHALRTISWSNPCEHFVESSELIVEAPWKRYTQVIPGLEVVRVQRHSAKHGKVGTSGELPRLLLGQARRQQRQAQRLR